MSVNRAATGTSPATNDALVASSWARCQGEYQLRREQVPNVTFLAADALHGRLARHADVIDCARHEMATLYQQLGDDDSAVVLTDTDGVIIHVICSMDFADLMSPLGLRVGAVWSEREAGTNGMGTCLAAGGPVSVQRDDHYFSHLSGLTCSAVPVFDPSGEIAAVLDLTSRSSVAQQHLLVLLGMTARMIENRLIDQRFKTSHLLHFHSRPEFVHTLHEGKLAVDAEGWVLAANRSAMFQLGLQSFADVRSRELQDLFQTTLETLVQRSTAAAFHPVVIYRAQASARFFVVARQPAAEVTDDASLPDSKPDSPIRRFQNARTELSIGRPRRPRAAPTCRPTFKDARLAANLRVAQRVIARQTPILLRGETGSGKEMFAKAVHERSPHAHGNFVAVNCASLPETLIEAELFGYRAGAFTGALRSGRQGKILQAHGGTLFLDEIADMPLDLQARLLRVLDERQVSPLGTEETHAVNFQLISASHGHLLELVQQGRFREDLYYRLAGLEFDITPLRDRTDIGDLIQQILAEEGGDEYTLSAEAERILMVYPWPGNLRQLRHVLRSATALSDGHRIGREHLQSLSAFIEQRGSKEPLDEEDELEKPPLAGLNPIQLGERAALLTLLIESRWNASLVAKTLRISRNTLYRKLHKLQIPVTLPSRSC